MTRLLAVDPGTERSAWLVLRAGLPQKFGMDPNEDVAAMLRTAADHLLLDAVVIEQVESYGMPVGREVFDTVWWAGRFTEAARPVPVVMLPRRTVKLHLTGSPRANDGNVRMALLDRFGGRTSAIGRKAAPGPLYGIANDVWSALAIAITHDDLRRTA